MLNGVSISKKIHKQVPLFINNVSSRTRELFLPCFRCRQLSFLDLYLQKIVSLTNFYGRGFCTFQIRSSYNIMWTCLLYFLWFLYQPFLFVQYKSRPFFNERKGEISRTSLTDALNYWTGKMNPSITFHILK